MENELQKCIRKALDLTPLLRSVLIRPQEVSPVADLPSTQRQALLILNSYSSLSMSALARKLAVSKQQLTKIADALVGRGLVDRRADEGNRRVVLLSLTEAGRDVIAALKDEAAKRMEAQFAHLSADELRDFAAAADTLHRLLEKIKN